ncbi:MAG: DUF6580 family putative transport protein [Oscillospiraceae bacterium]
MTKAYNIALVGILSAVNVSSRVAFQFLPNIKPVTSIVMLTAMFFGLYVAVQVVVTTTLLSGVLLGLGPYVLFQIAAWVVIALATAAIHRCVKQKSILLYTLWAGLCGFVFGFVVSLEKLLYGWAFFLAYYVAGLPFDGLHALGNLLFFPICYFALSPVFKRANHTARR